MAMFQVPRAVVTGYHDSTAEIGVSISPIEISQESKLELSNIAVCLWVFFLMYVYVCMYVYICYVCMCVCVCMY